MNCRCPVKDQAKEIIVAHLDYYRKNQSEKGSIAPFTDEGIDELLKNQKMLHPRILLSNAAMILSHAVETGKESR